MTHLSAAAIAIDVLGRETAAPTNPELAMAHHARQSGGILSWLRNTAVARALAERRGERVLNRHILRLSELSPHLLADIGFIDTSAAEMPLPVQIVDTGAETRIVAAPVPVPPRPALRPAIALPQRATAPAAAKTPAQAESTQQSATQ